MYVLDARDETTEDTEVVAERAGPSAVRRRLDEVRWHVLLAVTVVLCALTPLRLAPRYYFNDDTQIGAFGIWFRIGELLRSGGIPFIEPSTWMAGNYFVEGQWGLLNPLILGTGLLASATDDAVLFSTVVKIVFLVVAALGALGLARSYGASRAWAFVAGLSVPLAGFTFYLDAATWVTGLITFSLVPWAWWMIRRMRRGGLHFLPVFVVGYLIITVGYVHGTIALVAVIGVNLLDLAIARAPREFLRLVLVGAALGLVAVTVFLPGVLTSEVTVRGSTSVMNDGFFVADLNGLLSSAVATSRPEVSAWWGPFATAPLLYISWALPLLAFVDVSRLRTHWRPMAGLLVFGLVMVLWIIGPSYVGPLRIPVRMMPYVALATLVAFSVVMTRARVRDGLFRRLALYVGLVAVSVYGAYAQTPDWTEALGAVTLVLLVAGAAYAAMWSWLARDVGRARREPALVASLAVVAAATTAIVQHNYMPGPPLADFQVPAQTALYTQQLTDARGDVFVVGEPTGSPAPDIWQETLLANQWYLSPQVVQNVYTPIGFAAYAEKLCINNRGEACAGALAALLSDTATGKPLVDLMGISTLQLVRSAFGEQGVPDVPDGWTVVEEGLHTVTWVRDAPVPGAGHVTAASDGLEIREIRSSPDEVLLAVDAVPGGGGAVTFSRLAWPGYQVEGAELVEPVEGILLTVEIPPGAAGDEVRVRFRPPGWGLELASLVTALGAIALVAGAHGVGALRRRQARGGSPSVSDRT